MKIIKAPQFNICACNCGTIFQPDLYDELRYRFDPADFTNFEIFARCPTCSSLVKVTTEGTPKKHFTPEDVRKMSQREVKENYQAIMDSMKKWK